MIKKVQILKGLKYQKGMVNMDFEYNAMIFLLKYSESSTFLFDAVTKLKVENNKIPFSLLVSIESQRIDEFEPYCACFIYEPEQGDNGRLDVLKELTNENFQSANNDNTGELINGCIVCKYHARWMFKINSKRIDYYGPGRYAVMLVKGTKEDIDNNVNYAFENQVSNVCFEVVYDEKAKND